MAKDYKHRAHNKGPSHGNETSNPLQSLSFWKWMLMTGSVISIVVFLVYWQFKGLRHGRPKHDPQQITVSNQPKRELADNSKNPEPIQLEPEHKPPRFDFYTILPEKEVVVPDYEINTRTREERVGKAKEAHYIMQAGSFRTLKETDQLRAKLGLLGIESTVHKAKVGNVIWYRVKIGPYAHMTSVSSIKSRLRQSGIDVVVTETGQ